MRSKQIVAWLAARGHSVRLADLSAARRCGALQYTRAGERGAPKESSEEQVAAWLDDGLSIAPAESSRESPGPTPRRKTTELELELLMMPAKREEIAKATIAMKAENRRLHLEIGSLRAERGGLVVRVLHLEADLEVERAAHDLARSRLARLIREVESANG
jgi:hypothetical protein